MRIQVQLPPSLSREWKPVPGLETLYEVSNDGYVRRTAPACGATVGYILKNNRSQKGYIRVRLSQGGRSWLATVHVLVAEAFLPPRPPGMQCNHKNGNKTENHVSNLEWTTGSENVRHAFRTGLTNPARGERNGNHKLTDKQVAQIRELRGRETGVATAKRFGVTPSIVSRIQLGKGRRA